MRLHSKSKSRNPALKKGILASSQVPREQSNPTSQPNATPSHKNEKAVCAGTNPRPAHPTTKATLSTATERRMTVSPKRTSEKQGQLVPIKPRFPAKRSSPTKAPGIKALRTTLEILDEATKMLIPLSLDEDCDVSVHQSMEVAAEYRPSPLQPDDNRRRMLRRGSKCPHMFFQELQSWKCQRSPSTISLPSLTVQRASSDAKPALFELPRGEHPTARPSALQAVQEGAKAA